MHAEMFPLIREDRDNPLELFQIWLNLPPESKMVDPYFGMLWSEEIPTVTPADGVAVDVVAGRLGDTKKFLGSKSVLHRSVLDTLHGGGVEIVSPTFMNQRQVGVENRFIPEIDAVGAKWRA